MLLTFACEHLHIMCFCRFICSNGSGEYYAKYSAAYHWPADLFISQKAVSVSSQHLKHSESSGSRLRAGGLTLCQEKMNDFSSFSDISSFDTSFRRLGDLLRNFSLALLQIQRETFVLVASFLQKWSEIKPLVIIYNYAKWQSYCIIIANS